jgi:ATP-dependent helicase/nuclease subunit A
MTIHASKGLEWPIVFVPNLSADKRSDSSTITFDAEIGAGFKVVIRAENGTYQREEPSILKVIRRKKKLEESKESARILYVAMTRAEDRLYLTSAGNENNDLAALKPGLELAGIEIQRHRPGDQLPLPEQINSENSAAVIEVKQQILKVSPHLASVPATGLVDYSICPKRFKYRYVDGHPGVGVGPSEDAARIGTLTHLALELGLRTVDDLRPLSEGASEEMLQKAMVLAENFYSADEFIEFRTGLPEREVSKTLAINGLQISCKVDRVGENYVLDFKTDSAMEPQHHAIQLWTYAQALNKTRAVVGYLRLQKKYEYNAGELSSAGEKARTAVKGIAAGEFASTPSLDGCRHCSYRIICSDRYLDQNIDTGSTV